MASASNLPAGQVVPGNGPAWLPATQLRCPVLPDEPVDPDVYTDHEGRRVLFCCARCRRQFLATPEAYAAALAAVTVADPVSGPGQVHEHGDHADVSEHGHDAAAQDPGSGTEDAEHDHATGHGDPHGVARLVRWLGKLHPAVVHFPIALFLGAALAALLERLRGGPVFPEAIRFCLLLGAAGAVVSASLGWAAAAFSNYPEAMAGDLLRHRWFGTGTAIWLALTALGAEMGRRTGGERWRSRARWMLFTGAALVAVTGHLGATLVFGHEYLSW